MAATEREWLAWTAYHGTLFGLTADSDARMFTAWASLFAASGYVPSELEQATRWLALNSPPRYRQEHLAALLARLRDQRRDGLRALEEETSTEPCPLCGDTGILGGVPDRRFVRDGEWVSDGTGWHPTASVACSCPKGRPYAEATDREGNRRMGLVEYSRWVPHFRQLMEHRAEIERAAYSARQQARERDQEAGEIRDAMDHLLVQLRLRQTPSPGR